MLSGRPVPAAAASNELTGPSPPRAERDAGQDPEPQPVPAWGLDPAAHPAGLGRVRSQPHREGFIRFPVQVFATVSLFSFPSRPVGAQRARGAVRGQQPGSGRFGSAGSGAGSASRGSSGTPGRRKARLCLLDRFPRASQPSEVSEERVRSPPAVGHPSPQPCRAGKRVWVQEEPRIGVSPEGSMSLRAPDPNHRRASKGQVQETLVPGCRRDLHPDVPADALGGCKGPEPCSA